jgi:hypothetical protein
MLLVELDWLQDAEFLGRIGRDALAVVLIINQPKGLHSPMREYFSPHIG